MALRPVGIQLTAEGSAAFLRAVKDGDIAIAGFGKSATEASGKVTSFGQIATGALRQVGSIAVDMAAQGIKALGGFFVDSVKKAGDFQAGMNEFAAVSGAALQQSGKSLKDFSDLFIQLGRDLPVSTKDVETAAINLVKAGIDPATVAAGGLRTALNLAAAGGLDLGASADILGKQLGVWVDTAASAADKSAFLADTADLLSQAANVTTSNVSDMALGLANVGGVAKLMGLDFHETVQTMAEISPSFSSAADAGTSFKTFLQRLQPTTKPAISAMKDLGLYTDASGSAFYDAQGKFVGMEKVSGLLQAATQGLTESQKSLALQAIFGADAIRVAALLSEKGTAGYDAMGKSMDAAGTVAAQAAARQQGLNTAWDNTQGSLEALQLTLGTQLIPMLTGLLNTTIAPAINAVTSFADSFFSASDKVGFLVGAINTALPGFSSLTTLVGNVITAFGTGGLSGALDALGAGLPAVGQMLLGFGQQFLAWIGPLIPQALTALGGFAASVGTWIMEQAPAWAAQVLSWGEAFIGWVTPYIGPALAMLGTFATSIGTWIVAQAPLWGAQLLTWGQAFVSWVSPYIAPALAKLGEFASSAWNWIVQQAPTWLTKLEGWGQSLLDWIGPKIPPLLSKLGELAASAWQWVQEQAPTWLTKLEAWGQSMVDWIGPKIPPLLAKLGELASSAWQWVTDQAPVLLGKLETWGESFINWIGPKIPPLLAKAGELASSLWTWISNQAAPLVTKLEAWGKSFIDWIGPATVKFLAEWPGFLNKFLDWIGTAAAPLLTKLGDWAVSFIKWVVPMIPDFVVALGGIAVALIAFVGETAITLLTKLAEWGQALGKWIKTDAIPALVGAWPGFLESLNGLLDKANTWMAGKAAEIGHALVNGIKAGVSALWSTFTGWIHDKVMEIPAAVRKALGISSPSKVMAEQVGVPMAQGIGQGFADGMGEVTPAMVKQLEDATKVVSAVVNTVGDSSSMAGMHIIAGMRLGVLTSMPDLLLAMRTSTDAMIQEIVSFVDRGDTTGTLNAAGAAAINALISGMNNGLAPAFREMPAWTGYTKDLGDGLTLLGSRADWMAGTARDAGDLGNGLRLLGDQTPVVQNLGNGLSLLGDQWARQAATMTDLAPKLPALATGFAAVGASVVHATDDILTHATYGKSSGMAFGYLNDGIQRVGEMTKITAGVISDVAPHWGESWKVMGDATVAALDRADQFAFGASKNILGYIDHAIQRIDDLIAEIGKIPGIHVNTAAATPFSTGALPGRALGGPVTAGIPYMVGERGRELFVPSTSGYVLPASLTQRIAPPASAQQIANSYSYSTTTHGPTLNYQPTYVTPARGVAQDFAIARALIGAW